MTSINAILTDGQNVDMPALRSYLSTIEAQLGQANLALATGTVAALVGTRVYATQAALFADLVPADDLFALVYADTDPLKNGLYQKDGATTAGNWDGPFDLFASAAEALVQPLVDDAEAAAAATAAAITVFDEQIATVQAGFYEATALGAAPSFVSGALQQAILIDCEGDQDFRLRNCVTTASLRPVLYFDVDDELIGSIDPGTTDETDYSGDTFTTPSAARSMAVNSNVFYANGDLVGPVAVDLERTMTVQRTADDARAARDSDAGRVDCAGVIRTAGVYARAYSPAATPASASSQVLEVPVTAGETIYFTGTARRGSSEFCFAQLLNGSKAFVSAIRQSAAGESDEKLVAEPVLVPSGVSFVRFTIDLASAWRVQRAGKKDYAGVEVDEAMAMADRVGSSLVSFNPSPEPVRGFYVRAYDNTGLVANTGSKYIPVQRVQPGQRIRVSGRTPNGEYALAVWRKDGAFVEKALQGSSNEIHYRKQLIVPEGVNEVWGSGALDTMLEIMIEQVVPEAAARITAVDYNTKRGKSMAHLGTSIPATPNPALGIAATATVDVEQVPATVGSYPQIIGAALGMTVYNEAIGSSPVRFGHASIKSGGDPLGITGLDWRNVAYALAATSAEKEDLITNWATYRLLMTGSPPSSLDDNPSTRDTSESGTNFIRNTSYEVRLARNLPSTRTVDLIIIDHGYNDLHTGIGGAGTDIASTTISSRDRSTFIGGVNYLIDYILAANPRQRIAFAEHYEDQLNPAVAQAQALLAAYWGFPLLPLARKLGWSQQVVDGDTLLELACPDGVHPHSDPTGIATMQIARQHIENIRGLGL